MGFEEASRNVSPVVDAFFDLCGPGADLLVIVRLKYQTPLTNLQKAGHTVYITHLFLCKMQEKQDTAEGIYLGAVILRQLRFVASSSGKWPPPEYGLLSPVAIIPML